MEKKFVNLGVERIIIYTKVIQDKISAFCSFFGNETRFPIYDLNFYRFSKMIPENLNVYVSDASDSEIINKNESILKEYFKNQKLFYKKESKSFLDSWEGMLKEIKTKYCISFFDDFYIKNLNVDFLEDCCNMFDENEDLDCLLFYTYDIESFDDEKKMININKSQINNHNFHTNLKRVYNGNKYNFNIIDNKNFSLCYGWFANVGIYRTEDCLKKVNYYKQFSNVHEAELNHIYAPKDKTYNLIAISKDAEVFSIDIDYVHVNGKREPVKTAKQSYEFLKLHDN